MNPHVFLRQLFDAAIAAADPARCVPPNLPKPPKGRTVVVAAGKAAASMARAVEDNWVAPLEGLAVTRYGHAVPCRTIEIIEAGHPLPDESGRDAARRALELVSPLGVDDLLLCLISGGGSALLSLPASGIPFADKRDIVDRLLRRGAAIGEINCVRKHLSAVKGGRLAEAATPARIVTLIISDVPDDDPATVASGPTVADRSTLREASAVLAKYEIPATPAIARHLSDGQNETPKSIDRGEAVVVATAADALNAAAALARAANVEPVNLGHDLEGDAATLARGHALLAVGAATAPSVLISGGEATVDLGRSTGRGGPNTEYALSLAVALGGRPGIYALAGDTDGIDGSGDNAGAFVTPDTLARAAHLGLKPAEMLSAHRNYDFFAALCDLVVTGPTLTNVNDFRAVLITAGAVANIDL